MGDLIDKAAAIVGKKPPRDDDAPVVLKARARSGRWSAR